MSSFPCSLSHGVAGGTLENSAIEAPILAPHARGRGSSNLQREARFDWKCASRHSGVQLRKVVRDRQFFTILTWKCASRHSGVQFFMSSLNSHLRTRRFSEVTFRPSRHTKHWKTQHFATSLTFRACWSSFFPHLLIFFLAALLFQLSILSEVRLLNFLWPAGHPSMAEIMA